MASASSAYQAFALTPNDGLILAKRPKRLYVGTGGDLTVILAHDDALDAGTDTVLFKSVPSGTFLDISVKRVMATGTAASNIVGLV